jgi:aryl-phospho-beta-D-glucosidase BglC (GH1 family)
MSDMTNMTAFDIVKEMYLGINWGNGFDSGTETLWGSPVITKAHFQALWDDGFRTLRIPASWGIGDGKATAENNYTIDKAFLDRYQEIVDYAMDIGFYTIINSHHDNWVRNVLVGDTAVPVGRIWSQLSERFKDYGVKLLFETMNEPRNADGVGGGYEWVCDPTSNAKINELNQLVVDIVRKSGGNNARRFVLFPPYGAHAYGEAMEDLVIPKNLDRTANDDRVIVSLHAYSPYNLCMPNDPGTQQITEFGTRQDILNIQSLFGGIFEMFIDKGIPVVLGEWATGNKDNTEARIRHAKYYVAAASKKPGIVCLWWCTGDNRYAVSGAVEGLGLYDRFAEPRMRCYYPEILQSMIDGKHYEIVVPEK